MAGLAMIVASVVVLWLAYPRNGRLRWPFTNPTVNAGVALAVVTGLALGVTLAMSTFWY